MSYLCMYAFFREHVQKTKALKIKATIPGGLFVSCVSVRSKDGIGVKKGGSHLTANHLPWYWLVILSDYVPIYRIRFYSIDSPYFNLGISYTFCHLHFFYELEIVVCPYYLSWMYVWSWRGMFSGLCCVGRRGGGDLYIPILFCFFLSFKMP